MNLEGVFGVLISIMFYGEVVSLRVGVGFILIFIAVMISEVLSKKEFPWVKRTI